MSFSRKTPPEIRNMLYKYAALPDGVDPEERSFKTVTQDGTISPSDTVRSFFLDIVSDAGKSTLFAKEITQVTELTQEVLTLVMPEILFRFNTPHALVIFAETFAAHANICDVVPELQVELDFAQDLSEEDLTKLSSWVECKQPHGRDIGMHDHVEQWMRAIQLLPEVTNIHLVFSSIWRDFRELRGLSKKFGVSKSTVTFQFPTPSIRYQDYSFFEAQTMAAVKDLEVSEQAGISGTKRADLVKFGCRGFNCARKYLSI
ncbi:hypothetical protein MMC27_005102 [Xylographa pallens]|nr:hypothetical protein [Xylographa pallens]